MRKFWLVTLIIAAVFIYGCSSSADDDIDNGDIADNNGENNDNVSDNSGGEGDGDDVDVPDYNTDRKEVDSKIIWADDDIYAAAYIGGYTHEMAIVKTLPMEKYIPDIEEYSEYDVGGYEKYLFVPRYTDMYIELYALELSNEGELVRTTEEPTFATKEGEPLLLTCNISDLFSNVVVVFKTGEEVQAEVSPFISLKDGSIIISEEGQLLDVEVDFQIAQ